MIDFSKLKDIKYKKLVVGFVDIMGFQNRVNETEINSMGQEKSIDTILSIQILLNLNSQSANRSEYLQVKAFSDCLYVFADEEHADDVIYFLGMLQRALLDSTPRMLDASNGYLEESVDNLVLLRGGVTYGNAFVDNDFMFGPAVNQAYQLENKDAVYPRIVVSESVFAMLKEQNRSIKTDYNYDNRYFIDYLGMGDWGRIDTDNISLYLSNIDKQLNDITEKREEIAKLEKKIKDMEKLEKKLVWMKKYLTKSCE